MKVGHRAKFKEDISTLTNGMIDTVIDAVLYITFNTVLSVGVRNMRQMEYAQYQSDVLLCTYNAQTIRRALDTLVSRKLIQRNKTPIGRNITISQEGIKRINEMIPTYKTHRPWDGYLYLISYDIPISSNTKRNLLREHLKRIGCGKLQDSLWMTPYNPTSIIDEFIEDHGIPGTILVSKLGKDGSIGDEDRKTLIKRVYGYEQLNERYERFIHGYTKLKNPSITQRSLAYHAILADDPQLPFALEPEYFLGKEAYRVFQS
ncbi:MAG: PaaX domain protein [Candidatus Gottesmanbacteria bacterium GW2011_GWB1_44_11c]|uniref:PaaX domain protein n=1 Tax=Candidatus Gottesmanbacteria bacterium GW2011_GWB1_44_11c TaxID=1618447 RepID=A0A0G1GNG4_9BACT|nr:MAG: PaaX domain protein [Candidatus Gottesmanbacteria bacterium GW2011_GWB1_44_11c]